MDLRPRVLLVSHEPDVLIGLEAALHIDYTTYMAADISSAREVLRSKPIDIIVVDHLMPDMTGLDLLREVRRTRPHILRLLRTGQFDAALETAEGVGEVFKVMREPGSEVEILKLAAAKLGTRRDS